MITDGLLCRLFENNDGTGCTFQLVILQQWLKTVKMKHETTTVVEKLFNKMFFASLYQIRFHQINVSNLKVHLLQNYVMYYRQKSKTIPHHPQGDRLVESYCRDKCMYAQIMHSLGYNCLVCIKSQSSMYIRFRIMN